MLQKVPFCLAGRICTIVGNSNIKKLQLEEFKNLLLSQQHAKEKVTQEIKEASIILSEVPFYEKRKEIKPVFLLISTYNQNYPTLFQLKIKTDGSLQHDANTKDVFKNII